MFELHAMPKPVAPGLLARLTEVETATVGHFFHGQFLDPALRAVLPDARVAGTAVTIAIPGADSTLLHHALGLVRPGDFLVIDRMGDARHACWGGVVTYAAKLAGVVGAVVDGMATDLVEVRQHRMPLWCRGPSPITTKQLALGGTLNAPVSCGGVTVHPGDAVLADESGVLILRPDQIEAVIAEALARQAREPQTKAKLDAGQKLGAISGASAKVEAALAAQKKA